MRELALVIPTYNERANVAPVLEKITAALTEIDWEAWFVDDNSPDETYAEVARIAAENPRVKILRRIGRRGLSTACIEGMLASDAPVIAVMDADMQHDETILPAMLTKIREENCDLVVGSRYADGGGTGAWNASRTFMSKTATRIGARLLGKNHTTDPMSGFFMLRRDFFSEIVEKLSGEGFKILLDILASSKRALKIGEVAYTFRTREFGESKLSLGVLTDFALLLADKTIGKIVPPRFLLFVLVGVVGAAVHFGLLTWLHAMIGFLAAQIIATVVAMTANFFGNNFFTYSDRAIHKRKMWRGLAIFAIVCGIGAVPNVWISYYLFANSHEWWLVAGGVGMLISAVWNFGVSQHLIWRTK